PAAGGARLLRRVRRWAVALRRRGSVVATRRRGDYARPVDVGGGEPAGARWGLRRGLRGHRADSVVSLGGRWRYLARVVRVARIALRADVELPATAPHEPRSRHRPRRAPDGRPVCSDR